MWLSLGFPHPSVSSLAHFHKYFPCSRLVETPANRAIPSRKGSKHEALLSEGVQQQLLGNAMHVSQIGPWFLFVLATTVRDFSGASVAPSQTDSGYVR